MSKHKITSNKQSETHYTLKNYFFKVKKNEILLKSNAN